MFVLDPYDNKVNSFSEVCHSNCTQGPVGKVLEQVNPAYLDDALAQLVKS